MRKSVLATICAVLAFSLFMTMFAKAGSLRERNNNSDCYIEVLWSYTCDTFDELYEKADLIIEGSVINQWTERNNNHVFTISEVMIEENYKGSEENTTIIIGQIGGKAGDYVFPFPEEVAPLSLNSSYVLFLNGFNGEYVIAGASQGVFVKEMETENAMEVCRQEFNLRTYDARIYETPVNGYQFPYSYETAYYYIQVFATGITSTNISYLKAGIQSWNGLSGINVYEASSVAWAQIIVNIYSSFGASTYTVIGSDVWAMTYANGSIYSKIIEISTSQFNTSYNSYWQKIGCHETGHALGLAHNTLSESCMNPYFSNMTLYPSEADVLTLRQLYGYPW